MTRTRIDADAAATHLAAVDAPMAALVRRWGPPALPSPALPGGHFHALARAVLYQQLTGRAAGAIHRRFVALFEGAPPTPAAVVSLPEVRLREAGLSRAKAAAVVDLASHCLDGTVPVRRLGRLDDEEVVARLTVVRGVGRWTAEMFLIFTLGRPDVWPVTDYGVRSGHRAAYGGELPTPRALDAAGERFRPYRSAAAWYLWRAAEVPDLSPG